MRKSFRRVVGWPRLAIVAALGISAAAVGPALIATSLVTGTADGSGAIPAGEYAGQAFSVHLTAEYSGFGLSTLTTAAGTRVQIGSERFEAIVSPAFGTFQSLCCGEGHTSADTFTMTGQVRHVTAPVPHNHLFGASASTQGYMCMNIADQTGSITETSDPAHDPMIGLICDIPATVTLGRLAYTVAIDIRPGSAGNAINPAANGVVSVAILTTEDFDAATVDPLTARFGPDGAAEIHGRGHFSDVTADGRADLVLHFATAATGIAAGSASASLTGKTFDGVSIEGSDTLVTAPQ